VSVASLPGLPNVIELRRLHRIAAPPHPPKFRLAWCESCSDWHWTALHPWLLHGRWSNAESGEHRETSPEEHKAAQQLAGRCTPARVTTDQGVREQTDRQERRHHHAATARLRAPVPAGEKPESLMRIRRKLIEDTRPMATHLTLIADGDFLDLTEQDRFELARRSAATNLFRRPWLRLLADQHRGQFERGRDDLREKGSKLMDDEVSRRLGCLAPDEWTRTVAVLVGCLMFQHPERLESQRDGYPAYLTRRSKPVPSKQVNWDLFLVRLLSVVRNEYLDLLAPGLQRWRAENKRSDGELAKTHPLSEFDPDAGDGRSEMGHDGDDGGDGGRIELASTDDIDALIDSMGAPLPGVAPEVERLLWLIVHGGYTREEASETLGKSKSWGGVVLHRLRDSDNQRVAELKWRLIRDKAIGLVDTPGMGKTITPRTHLGFWGIPPGSVAHTTRVLRGKLLFPGLRKTDYTQPGFWNLCNETAPKRELVSAGEERYRRRWWHRPNLHLSVAETLERTSIALVTEPMGRPLPDGHPSNVAFVVEFWRNSRASVSPDHS
jgi:hypothetical protein